MKPVSDLQRLKDEWYARARASGFVDIESPSGDIARRSVPETRLAEVAELEAARAFLHTHTFATPFEREVWDLHAHGASNRGIQRLLKLTTRKRIDKVIARLTTLMLGAPVKRRRGRRPDADSLRAEALQVTALLMPAHRLALDHIRVELKVSAAEAIRRGLMELRNRISRSEKRPR